MDLYNVYPVFPINIVRGNGCYVFDDNENKYLDLYGGHAVISLGHSNPRYVNAISQQVSKLGFYSNSVINPLQKEYAKKLGEVSGYPDYSLFLVNSGAEANENALKLASFHNNRTRVIAFNKAFHGRTSLAVEATDNPKIIAKINNNSHVTFLALNDIESVRKELAKEDVSAVIIEGLQGIGGIHQPNPAFLEELRELCTKHNTVLILDEIQSGCGRTGKYFAHQYANIKPDLITMAKGIGNGFPMGGLLISPIFKAEFGQLGTTFGGNHLACSAGLAVLQAIEEDKLIDNALFVGNYLMNELRKNPKISEVRGLGLMIGLEFDFSISDIRKKLLFEENIFTGVSGQNTLRLLPPLSLSMEQADFFIKKIGKVLNS